MLSDLQSNGEVLLCSTGTGNQNIFEMHMTALASNSLDWFDDVAFCHFVFYLKYCGEKMRSKAITS